MNNPNKINALIVDDNPGDILILKEKLLPFKNINIVSEANNGYECLDILEKENIDVVFLDIDMPQLNGLDLAKIISIQEKCPLIVFITGRKDYALEAFEVSAIDYILKPFDFDRIKNTIDKILNRVSNEPNKEQLKTLIQQLKSNDTLTKKIAVKDSKERAIKFINIEDLIYAERSGRQVLLQLEDLSFQSYISIEKLYENLKTYDFYKISQSSLVNLSYVDHMIPNGDGTYSLTLKSLKNKFLTVSRQHSKEILNKLSLA